MVLGVYGFRWITKMLILSITWQIGNKCVNCYRGRIIWLWDKGIFFLLHCISVSGSLSVYLSSVCPPGEWQHVGVVNRAVERGHSKHYLFLTATVCLVWRVFEEVGCVCQHHTQLALFPNGRWHALKCVYVCVYGCAWFLRLLSFFLFFFSLCCFFGHGVLFYTPV